MLINYLGEVGEDTPLASAITVSNPYDIGAVASYLKSYFLGRNLIDRHFTSVYRDTLFRHEELFTKAYSEWLDKDLLRTVSSVDEFDENFSIKAYGFNSVEEYYYVSSCFHNLHKVKIPLLVIHAADDPVAPISVVPVERLKSNPNIVTAITQHGGHSGWLEGMNPFNRPAWIDRVACEWIDTMIMHGPPSPIKKAQAKRAAEALEAASAKLKGDAPIDRKRRTSIGASSQNKKLSRKNA